MQVAQYYIRMLVAGKHDEWSINPWEKTALALLVYLYIQTEQLIQVTRFKHETNVYSKLWVESLLESLFKLLVEWLVVSFVGLIVELL